MMRHVPKNTGKRRGGGDEYKGWDGVVSGSVWRTQGQGAARKEASRAERKSPHGSKSPSPRPAGGSAVSPFRAAVGPGKRSGIRRRATQTGVEAPADRSPSSSACRTREDWLLLLLLARAGGGGGRGQPSLGGWGGGDRSRKFSR